MEEQEGFWERVNGLIKMRNTTQRAVSLALGMSERRIQNLSGSGRLPDVIEGYGIANELNTSVEYLVTGNSVGSVGLSPELSELVRMYSDLDESDRKVVMMTLGTLHERYSQFTQQRKSGLTG